MPKNKYLGVRIGLFYLGYYFREMKQLWHASHDLSAFIASYGPQWVEQTVELIEKDAVYVECYCFASPQLGWY